MPDSKINSHWSKCGFLGVDFVFFIYQGKYVCEQANGLGVSQLEKTPGVEGVMEDRDDLLLQHRPQVDEHIPATDKVQLGERRVFGQVMPGEHKHITDGLVNLVAAI